MIPTATKNRRGLMGPNHVRRLARVESIVKDPLAFTDIEPTLDLDFTDIKGAPFAGNLTRATVGGYRMNSKGVLVPTVANEPVIDFGTDGKPVGTGFWGAYTNLLLRSEELDNAAWTKTLTTISANVIAGPDGATTFDKIVEDSSAGTHIAIQTVSLANGSTFTGSVTLKAAERTFVRVRLGDSGFVADAVVNLSTGTIVSGTGGTSFIESLGNGFYRVSVTGTVAAGNIASIQITLRQSSSIESYTGDGVSGLYAGQLSITATAFPVPYVPTTSATVTRNADSMLISGTDFTDFFNAVEGTFFVDFVNIRPSRHLFHVTRGAGTYGPRIQHIININTFSSIAVYDDANTLTGYAETINSGVSTGKSAVSYKLNEFKISVNGSAVIQDTAGALPTGLTRLEIARSPNQDVTLDGYIRRLIYFPKALDAATLQRMTA